MGTMIQRHKLDEDDYRGKTEIHYEFDYRSGARALDPDTDMDAHLLWVLRDVLGLVSFVLAYTRRTVIWRGRKFILTLHGRLEPVDGTNPPGVRPEERQRAAADPDSPVVGAESLVAAEDERSENMRADARGGGKSWSSISALLAAAFLR